LPAGRGDRSGGRRPDSPTEGTVAQVPRMRAAPIRCGSGRDGPGRSLRYGVGFGVQVGGQGQRRGGGAAPADRLGQWRAGEARGQRGGQGAGPGRLAEAGGFAE
jgi:hypothetical protein